MKNKEQERQKFWGNPIIGLILVTPFFLAPPAVSGFVAMLGAGLFDAFLEIFFGVKWPALVILIGIALTWFLSFMVSLIFGPIKKIILRITYRQASTIFFKVYFIGFHCIVGILSIGMIENYLGYYSLLLGRLSDLVIGGALTIESYLGWGALQWFAENAASLSSEYFNLFLLLATIGTLPGLRWFREVSFDKAACQKCKRAYIMRCDSFEEGESTYRAEFSKKSGYWETQTANISEASGLGNQYKINYKEYVPGTTDFEGIYKHTEVAQKYKCPICGETKNDFYTRKDRVL